MADWKKAALPESATIREAIASLDRSALQIVLIVDGESHLKGTITDGDIRRALLRGEGMEAPVTKAMKENPITAGPEIDRATVLKWMKQFGIAQVPVVDHGGHIVGLETLNQLVRQQDSGNWVVIMAGGLGTRLRPLTEDLPKPLIPVGGKPVLEGIIERLAEQGFKRLFLSVNYQSEKVEDYFKDGSKWGVEITYLEENKRLGTAGALHLLPERPVEPFLVMNADLMTDIDFRRLIDFHNEQEADATMGVRDYRLQVPYGVIDTRGHRITGIVEKPVQSYFVNGGIYALSPSVLSYVPEDEMYDMPELFEALIKDGGLAAAFPIHEYWIDIGRFEDLDKAQEEYGAVFGKDGAVKGKML
ncbi:putative mannose-1-phosphate guanyltransferase [Tepidicaulis marinus]|uniref:Putative mannose-1-phosphate guanyltransferase n=1 Tax=Tepidicaulis marinus TaxID=1333998 RepID=A0A081B9Q7_9HYPH|nr:nucleotidyltransferase family protein [Tepidicaulis marinus]GAK44775.1 putative mannose-1-phosphate guanyltransferase [Tepidicaulis marinus]